MHVLIFLAFQISQFALFADFKKYIYIFLCVLQTVFAIKTNVFLIYLLLLNKYMPPNLANILEPAFYSFVHILLAF